MKNKRKEFVFSFCFKNGQVLEETGTNRTQALLKIRKSESMNREYAPYNVKNCKVYGL